jgi:hypothetical protein
LRNGIGQHLVLAVAAYPVVEKAEALAIETIKASSPAAEQ